MKRLLFTALLASRRERHGGGGGSGEPTTSESGPITDATVNETTTVDTPPPELNLGTVGSSGGADSMPAQASVDTDGVIQGPGFEQQEALEVDVVHMPQKIVAKDIVGRAALKCTKKWKPTLDKNNNPMEDKDGNPVGEWEVTPPRALYVVFGTASGTRTGTSQYGDWSAFTGVFEAQRFSDGARFASNECILQEPANTLLLNKLGAIKKRDPSGSVGFSFEIGVRTSQRWVDTGEGSSYEFTVKSIFNVDKHDPLAAMRRALLPHLPKPPPAQLKGPEGSTAQS